MPELVKVGNALLAPTAAASYRRCLALGAPGGVTSSYRDPAYQQQLRDQYLAGNYPAYVAPVEKSDHPKGLAIDLPKSARAWFRAHGKEHGWLFTDPTEDWHIAYRIAYDKHLTDPEIIPDLIPVQKEKETDDMMTIFRHPDGTLASVQGHDMRILHTMVEADALRATGQVVDGDDDAKWIHVLPNPQIWDALRGVAQRGGTYYQ